MQYTNNNIIIPYVENVQMLLSDKKPASIIMDNFRGQATPSVSILLEDHDIHAYLLQPMDISVNKACKRLPQGKITYFKQVMKQLEGVDIRRDM